jgi:vitamin B12 transporter
MRALILFKLIFLAIFAQAQTIAGNIKTAKGKPIVGASITLKDTYDGATTDSAGHFSFTTTEKGEQLLVVTAVGFVGIEEKINLNETIPTFNFNLKEEFNEMKAVVITAGSFEASDRKRASAVLTSLDIVTTASGNGDVTGALKTLPGAQQVGETEGLFVRGGTAAETKIFIDGTLVNRFYYGSAPNTAGYGRFNPFLFKGTVFSTGGYSALYGQALSSAVILESIDLPDRTSASLGITALSLNGGYQYLNKKKTASWGLTYDYTNLALAFAVIKQQQDYSKAPEIHNIEGNFRIKTSQSGMLKYYGVFSTSQFAGTTPSLDSSGYLDFFKLKNGYTYHNLAWKERLGTYWKFNLGVSYSNNSDKINSALQDANKNDVSLSGLEFKNFAANPVGDYVNAKTYLERRLSGLSAIRFGAEYNFSNDHATFVDHNNNHYTSSVREHVASAFAETDIYLTNALAAKLGTRVEHSSYLDKANIAPRISLAYRTGKSSQASLAYGIFYQDPETKYLPSPYQLNFSRATHYIAQYQKTTNLIVFRTEIFYKKYHDLVKTGFANGREGIAINNNGFGEAKGFEIFWRDKKTIKDLDYWISYSYLDTKRDFLNFPYAIMPNFAAKHTANLVIKKFVLPWKTGFNIAYNYASSRPYYNIQYTGSNYKFADKGKVPDYHNVSFSLNWIPTIGKQNAKSFAVYVLSVSNIFNLDQTYGYSYSYDGLKKQAVVPPSKMFVFIGAFFSFGIDRTQDAINNNL